MHHGLGEKITFRCTTTDATPVFLCGSTYDLGNWNPDDALPMQKQPSAAGAGEWSHQLDMQPGTTFEFKFLKKGSDWVEWERGDNRRFTVIPGAHTLSDSFRK